MYGSLECPSDSFLVYMPTSVCYFISDRISIIFTIVSIISALSCDIYGFNAKRSADRLSVALAGAGKAGLAGRAPKGDTPLCRILPCASEAPCGSAEVFAEEADSVEISFGSIDKSSGFDNAADSIPDRSSDEPLPAEVSGGGFIFDIIPARPDKAEGSDNSDENKSCEFCVLTELILRFYP